jgi:hypothetical protein
MIMHAGLERAEYAGHLETLIKEDNLVALAGGTPEGWANESLGMARRIWVQDDANLDDSYYDENIERLDRQLALAGLRLAKLLNETIGTITPRDFD